MLSGALLGIDQLRARRRRARQRADGVGSVHDVGEPGPGKWITIYANPGHMFMVVAGWRFDTTALRSGGTRWTRDMRPTAGFTVRHPPGL